MKTIRTHTAVTAAVALMGLACVSPAFGSPSAAHQEKIYSGGVTCVNASDKTIGVRGFLFTRHFDLATDCKVSLQDKARASLGDLRPGQQVDIRYANDHGVLIAENIAQHNLTYSGHITALDAVKGTLLVRNGLMTREFSIAPHCAVLLKDNKMAGLNNLQIGDAVNLVYEPWNGSKIARRITQNSSTFVGTIAAIDTSTRSVKAMDARGEKTFRVEEGCPIVVNGKLDESLRHLQVGDRITVNYNNTDGVLVANRISPMPAPTSAAPTPAQAVNTDNQWHNYSSIAP